MKTNVKYNYSINFLKFHQEYLEEGSKEDQQNGFIDEDQDCSWTLREVNDHLIENN